MTYPDITSVPPQGVFSEIPSHGASFSNLRDVYLGTADDSDWSQDLLKKISESYETSSTSVYSSCGGFLSLNLLNALVGKKVKSISFFDINKHSVEFSKSVVNLIKASNSVQDFIQNYFMISVGRIADRYFFTPTLQEDRDSMFSKNKEHYNEVSQLIFEAISKSPYDRDQLYINGFMHVGGCGVGRVSIYPEGKHYSTSNSLAVGDGWLKNDEVFLKMRDWLAATDINHFAIDIKDLITEPQDIVFASNIDVWTPFSCHGKVFP